MAPVLTCHYRGVGTILIYYLILLTTLFGSMKRVIFKYFQHILKSHNFICPCNLKGESIEVMQILNTQHKTL
jgi:hypothetical protein